MPAGSYHFEPLDRRHDRAAFSCGNADLDRYLKQYARQDMERRVAAVFVLSELTTNRILGYYTLSSSAIEPDALPPETTHSLPRYGKLPVVLLGRLAVDLRFQGQGIGGRLLGHALRRALKQSSEIAAIAVVVEAKDDSAQRFYERFGFQRLVDQPSHLFIPMTAIERFRDEE